jgi:hypothetical protein
MSIFEGAKPFQSKMKKEEAPKADRLSKNLQFE